MVRESHRAVLLALGLLIPMPAFAQEAAPVAAAPVTAAPVTVAPEAEGAMPTLSWKEALDRALATHPNLMRAQAELAAAETRIRQARAGWLPKVGVAATYTRLDSDRVLGERVLAPANQIGAQLQLQVPLFAPGPWLEQGRAEQAAGLSGLTRDETKRALVRLVLRLHQQVGLQHKLLDTAKQAEATARQHHDIAAKRLEAGTGPKLDVLRADREIAEALGRQANATADLGAAQALLGAAVGLPMVDARPGPLGLALPQEKEAFERLSHRPDLAEAEGRVALAERTFRERWSDWSPTLTANGTPFLSAPATPTVPNAGWQATVQLQWSVWDGGRREALHDELQTRITQAIATRDGLKRQAEAELRTALVAVKARRDARDRAVEVATATEEAARLVRRGYEEGSLGSLERVDAERSALDASIAQAVAEDAVSLAEVELLAATGWVP